MASAAALDVTDTPPEKITGSGKVERAKILIVDDEQQNLDLLARILRNQYAVDTTTSPMQGLEFMDQKNYALIISDQRMPGMSGSEFLMQALQKDPNAVRMIVTGYSDLEALTQAINDAGVSSYLHKPFSAATVKSAVDTAMRVRDLTIRNSGLVRHLEESNRILTADVEERKRQIQKTQAHLMQADRMASLGTMAAGISHEINNPLAYVIANLGFMDKELSNLRNTVAELWQKNAGNTKNTPVNPISTLDELRTVLAEAQEGADRVKTIVRDLKTFARSEDDSHKSVQVRPILESTISMAWNEIRHRARLVRQFGDVPPVRGNKTKLAQVFLNLVVNAAHAIREGDCDKQFIGITTSIDAIGRVVVEIKDSGVGIPSDHLSRIFDPFFTTKPVGLGTGLGLSICHGIITKLGGEISVDSTVGEGTTVRVFLPAGDKAEADAQALLSRPLVAVEDTRRGRILVVDDEAPLARALKRHLATEHEVVLATGGEEALDILKNDKNFDVIFCDLLMPNVPGMDVYEEIQRTQPDVAERFIFMTGSAFTQRARTLLATVQNPRLDKPFDIGRVRALTREFIERRSQATPGIVPKQ